MRTYLSTITAVHAVVAAIRTAKNVVASVVTGTAMHGLRLDSRYLLARLFGRAAGHRAFQPCLAKPAVGPGLKRREPSRRGEAQRWSRLSRPWSASGLSGF
jgi:hypothetical protein